MFSEGNSYIRNIFRENGAGVAVMYTKRVEMIENTFENNWGPSAYGLLLKDISRSKIINNKFTKNTIGIYSEGSTEILIKNNSFSENGWAMKMLGNCTDDTIVNNDFFNNTFDVSTNSSVSRNYFDANYWDKYNGYDLNRDDVGDVSYRPVSLFSTLVEHTPEAILLVRSFLVDLIDLTEKIMPVFIPETLVDNHPLMKHKNLNL
jgi:nitrous oxidase accessory protein